MSHVVTLQTNLTDLVVVCKALDFLGLSYSKDADVRLWNSRKTHSQIVVNLRRYDIGLSLENGKVKMTADDMAFDSLVDFPAIKAYTNKEFRYISQETFGNILSQAYSIVKAREVAMKLGHQMHISAPDEFGVVHARVVTA